MTKQEKIDKIKKVMGGVYIGTDVENIMLFRTMIGNVLEYQINNDYISIDGRKGTALRTLIVERRDMYDEDIEDQSEECIDLIYNLLPNA